MPLAALVLLSVIASGCSSIPFFGKDDDFTNVSLGDVKSALNGLALAPSSIDKLLQAATKLGATDSQAQGSLGDGSKVEFTDAPAVPVKR